MYKLLSALGFACLAFVQLAQAEPQTSPNIEQATLAGGCFWCTEADVEKLNGVLDVVSGYAGGHVDNPTYKQVSAGNSGHIEVIQVTYDASTLSYSELLDYFWRQMDPTDSKGSFVDRGPQYRPAIFYHNDVQHQQAKASIKLLEQASVYEKSVDTELIAFTKFWPAEDYHQDYYKKNPLRYKYYRYRSGRDQFLDAVWGKDRITSPKTVESIASEKVMNKEKASKSAIKTQTFKKPSDQDIKQRLTPLQYKVTQEDATERPFENEYWDNKEVGLYVDIVSGEPLFSSQDKFKSGTGWPSFTQPINEQFVVTKTDYKLFYPRTEVRSKFGNSHLGHVFEDGPAPTGLRYCINSASMKFIPKADLKEQGYADYLAYFK